jgi:UDP-3-O-[3-hydroxymyristoyl] glucosamine N-acyltransferase
VRASKVAAFLGSEIDGDDEYVDPHRMYWEPEGLIVECEKHYIKIRCGRPRLSWARVISALFPLAPMERNVVWGEGSFCKTHACVGGQGFGFERDERGVPVRLPHIGRVVIGTNVEVGDFTTVCRGTIGDTTIGNSVKIDDHVHVAHNVTIGDETMIAAGAVVCGSAKIGRRCWIGAGAMIKEGLIVGDDVTVGLGAVVVKGVPQNRVVAGNPAREI